jgi:hypothetical protein
LGYGDRIRNTSLGAISVSDLAQFLMHICLFSVGNSYFDSDENTKEEDLIHPEDIEHFRLHDELEDEAERVAALDKLAIVEQNIPAKFRRGGQ